MKDIRMVVTDLDSTLLRRDKTVSDFTLQTIRDLRRSGVIFAVATARPRRSVRIPLPWLSFDAGVFHNGALAYAGDTLLAREGIGEPLPLIRSILAELPKTNICIEINDTIYANFDTRSLWPNEVFTPTPDFHEIAGMTADKLIIECTSLEQMRRYEKFLPPELYMLLSEHVIAMIMNRRATKLNGIRHLADHYNIPLESIVAFGDDYNDIEMLNACGVGVAVANALPEVRAAANCITLSNEEDGEARWIAENLL